MPHRLLLDEDVHVAVARGLVALGYDAVTAREQRLLQSDDETMLDVATELGRVLLTHNIKDFELLARDRFRRERPHAGILLARRAPVGNLVKRLELWLQDHQDRDTAYVCDWLPLYTDRLGGGS